MSLMVKNWLCTKHVGKSDWLRLPFRLVYRILILISVFPSFSFLSFLLCSLFLKTKKNKNTKKNTNKKISKTPLPGCKSWRKKFEHWKHSRGPKNPPNTFLIFRNFLCFSFSFLPYPIWEKIGVLVCTLVVSVTKNQLFYFLNWQSKIFIITNISDFRLNSPFIHDVLPDYRCPPIIKWSAAFSTPHHPRANGWAKWDEILYVGSSGP